MPIPIQSPPSFTALCIHRHSFHLGRVRPRNLIPIGSGSGGSDVGVTHGKTLARLSEMVLIALSCEQGVLPGLYRTLHAVILRTMQVLKLKGSVIAFLEPYYAWTYP